MYIDSQKNKTKISSLASLNQPGNKPSPIRKNKSDKNIRKSKNKKDTLNKNYKKRRKFWPRKG